MAPVRCSVPGERLCSTEDCAPGYGTFCRHGYIFASLAGYIVKKSDNGLMPIISVVRDTDSHLLPDVGSVVTCKVTSINSRFAKVQIMYIGSTPLRNTFRGTIRKEDIRATEKDKERLWCQSAGVRCSVQRRTLKNRGKLHGCSQSFCRRRNRQLFKFFGVASNHSIASQF
ncbi:exosome component 1 L homeolog isoform X1 [Xenopus laevis]|uniref:Exosome component 1 L homeolog isoform X1 n=1 Tax=Xenopus laevis TaxID=8355 RepID=A0A8J1L4J0_XENLA|nr:exosome component 1 L homeolog isoform X1 [Xenopus laevis]